MTESNVNNSRQFIVFTLDNLDFGVDILDSKEIIDNIELTEVPDSPFYVEGLIDLRGEVVPVVNLKKRLNMETSDQSEGKIIITSIEGKLIGVKVDKVKEIIRIDKASIITPPELTESNKYIKGVGKSDDDLIIILDLTNIFSSEIIGRLTPLAF